MDFPIRNVLCEAQRVVWLKCEEFCSKTVDRPRIDTEGGSIDTQLGSCHFLGGEGGREGGSIDTQLGSCHFLGGEGGEGGGSIDTQLGSCHFLGGEGGEEGGSIDTQLGSCHFLGGEGGEGREGRGGRSTLNLERIHKDYGRITSDNADLGGGSIDTQLGKDLQRLWKDRL